MILALGDFLGRRDITLLAWSTTPALGNNILGRSSHLPLSSSCSSLGSKLVNVFLKVRFGDARGAFYV